MHHLPASQRSPLNLSITRALFAGLLAATPLLPGAIATAQAAPAEQSRSYAIPAGNLDQALNRFASEAGILLSVDSRLTAGKRSPGLSGSFTVDEGLVRLLAGTGLAPINAGGNYALEPVSSHGDALELGATSVNAQGLGATTEGTGSYTTGSTSTATKMNLSIRETPQTITVVTRQRMDDQHLGSMTEVLKQTPGITMSQDGGERFNIYSRGSQINTYQIDGVTTTQENQTRTMPGTLLDMALYDHIEIVRGATGLMTGAGDPSGVVNLIHKRPTNDFQSYVKAGIGSWDYYRAEADVSGPLVDSGKLRGRFVAAKQDNHSFMDWYGQNRDILYGVIEADLTDTTLLRFGVDFQKYKATGSPGVPLMYSNGQQTHFSRSTSSGARWAYEDLDTRNYTVNLEQQLAHDWQLKVAANYMDVDRDLAMAYYSTGSGISTLNPLTNVGNADLGKASASQEQKGLDVILQGPFELFGQSHELILGGNYSEYDNSHYSLTGGSTTFDFDTWNNQLPRPASYTPLLDFNINSRQSGYFVATRLNFTDDLHLILGARASDYAYNYYSKVLTSGYLSTYHIEENGVVTPYAGIVYDFTPEQSVYVSYTDIFKPQSSQDRTGKVLDPVVGKNFELGWKGEFIDGRLNASTALYWIERDNVAELDAGYKVPGTTTDAYRAVSGAKTRGIDLELSGEILPGWNLQTGFSHSATEDAAGNRMLTQLPEDTLRLWSTYRLPGQWDKLTLGGGVNWNSKTSLYFTRYNSRVKQDDYAVASLMARYQIDENLSTTLNLDNLFDQTYYNGFAGNYGHYGAPRNATVSLRYDF